MKCLNSKIISFYECYVERRKMKSTLSTFPSVDYSQRCQSGSEFGLAGLVSYPWHAPYPDLFGSLSDLILQPGSTLGSSFGLADLLSPTLGPPSLSLSFGKH